MIHNLKKDLGDISINKIDLSSLEDDIFAWLDTGELFQFGFGMGVGFNNDIERIFYTYDFEESFQEVILPKGSLLKIFEAIKKNSIRKNALKHITA